MTGLTFLAIWKAVTTHWKLSLMVLLALGVMSFGSWLALKSVQGKLDRLQNEVANQKVTVRLDQATLAQALAAAKIVDKETVHEQPIIERQAASVVRVTSSPGAGTQLPAGFTSSLLSELRNNRAAAASGDDLHDAGSVSPAVSGTGPSASGRNPG